MARGDDMAGHIVSYPCDCQGSGHETCWIVHHTSLSVPESYPSRRAAAEALARLRGKGKEMSKASALERKLLKIFAGYEIQSSPIDLVVLVRWARDTTAHVPVERVELSVGAAEALVAAFAKGKDKG